MDRDQEEPDSEKGERPVAYDSHLHVRLAKKYRSLGATDKDLAEAFNVPLKTLFSWRSKHPQFSAACNEPMSKLVQVEEALFKLATGYTYWCEKPMGCNGEIVTAKYQRYVRPSFTAGQFLLLNLRPDKWKHHSKIVPAACSYNPLAELARKLEGTAFRPKED